MCFLVNSEEIHIKSYQHECQNMGLTRRIPIDMIKWTGENPRKKKKPKDYRQLRNTEYGRKSFLKKSTSVGHPILNSNP